MKRAPPSDEDDCDEILLGQDFNKVPIGHLPKFWKDLDPGEEIQWVMRPHFTLLAMLTQGFQRFSTV